MITYVCHSFWSSERNPHSSFKLEHLVLVWAINEKLAKYFTGEEIEVYSDNNSLVYLEAVKLGALEQRGVAQLPHFNYKIHYKPGRLNGHVDALSCFPVEEPMGDLEMSREDLEVAPSVGTP